MHWVRLWCDMPLDPKWRVIARRSGRSISEVIAVYVHMLANAGANASERGSVRNWSDEDVAAALDVETNVVTAIREAMQGKTLDGDKLTGWEKRQPNREDGSAERSRAWRERKRTQTNAGERPDSDSDSDKKPPKPPHGGARGASRFSRRKRGGGMIEYLRQRDALEANGRVSDDET